MRTRRRVERVKTGLIVLLAVGAAASALASGLFDQLLRTGAVFTALEDILQPELDGETQVSPAALPTTAMASLREGDTGYCGYRTDYEDAGGRLSDLYDLFSPTLGEALGSSGQPEAVTTAAWESALGGVGVFFGYDVELTVELLATWLGTEPGGATGPVRQLCLLAEGETVELYYTGGDGDVYRCDTAAPAEVLLERMSGLRDNGARYAYTQETYTGPDPYGVLMADYSRVPAISARNAVATVYDNLEDILDRLEINTALGGSYPEGDERVFVEGDATLRISSAGKMVYQNRGETGRLTAGDGTPDLAGAIESARRLAVDLLAPSAGNAVDIYLTDWQLEGDTYTVTFGYYMGGLPVWTEEPAAAVVITGGYITDITLMARQYVWSGHVGPVPPELPWAAAAGDSGIVLAYPDAGSIPEGEEGQYATLEAKWLYAEGGTEVEADG